MQTACIYVLLACSLCLFACRTKTIKGNGVLVSQKRKLSKAEHLVFKENFEVFLQPGPTVSLAIETDKNLQPFVLVTETKDSLVFSIQKKRILKTENGIRIILTTPMLRSVYLGGTGTITGQGKFTGAESLQLHIAGNGEIVLNVNTPKVVADIAGFGNLILAGETEVAEFDITGSGEYNAINLKAETSRVNIIGNGTVRLFAASLLDINIVGNGFVYYKGNPSIKQKILGVGTVKRADELGY